MDREYQHITRRSLVWVSLTKPLGVENVEMTSHSLQVNKSSTSKKAWWISLVVVLTAGQRVVIRLVLAASVAHARCTRLFAPSVESRRKYHSCPRMIALSIVALAMTKSGWHATKRIIVIRLIPVLHRNHVVFDLHRIHLLNGWRWKDQNTETRLRFVQGLASFYLSIILAF